MASLDVEGIGLCQVQNEDLIRIAATVTSGLEQIAKEEVEEKVGTKVVKGRGRIRFDTPFKDFAHKIQSLRTLENLHVVVADFEKEGLSTDTDKDAVLTHFYQLAKTFDWGPPVCAWKTFTGTFPHEPGPPRKKQKVKESFKDTAKMLERYDNIISRELMDRQDNEEDAESLVPPEALSDSSSTTKVAVLKEGISETAILPPQEDVQTSSDVQNEVTKVEEDTSSPCRDPSSDGQDKSTSAVPPEAENHGPLKPKFRVTCNRGGAKHCFTSMDAARYFGGGINDDLRWPVDLTKFDIEVVLNIYGDQVTVMIALTKESLHRRNIQHFGPTTLRSTIVYSMLRIANVQPGEVICDPMCGSGAISIEGGLEYRQCLHLSGDNHECACPRTRANIATINNQRRRKGQGVLPVDTLRWDVGNLPLRTESVDVFITDMPFGKRHGSKQGNWELYRRTVRDMARVCRFPTGRAVLLTEDKKCLNKVLAEYDSLWNKKLVLFIKMGGLDAAIYQLKRTNNPFPKFLEHELLSSKRKQKKMGIPRSERVGEPITEQPTQGEPITEQPTQGEPITEQPTQGEPITEQPTQD
ncbi:PREDICTED: THUMP domain-containing protein 3-like [Branchiostoma belcheri]|uniref:THUMP domain-containing protein 3-like n=1 Tax=Branchiostoma belcheri TaxID=7741 RepID=A0A6P4Y527_BRABE|nr:PREDICTED: THUMP domain-containing protein 3-like [Branchiostoma belcheri]